MPIDFNAALTKGREYKNMGYRILTDKNKRGNMLMKLVKDGVHTHIVEIDPRTGKCVGCTFRDVTSSNTKIQRSDFEGLGHTTTWEWSRNGEQLSKEDSSACNDVPFSFNVSNIVLIDPKTGKVNTIKKDVIKGKDTSFHRVYNLEEGKMTEQFAGCDKNTYNIPKTNYDIHTLGEKDFHV